ncbi:uncharacterized protein TNCV_3172011 [Trichonephila clavipes]|nr:uncharacterized protein TNCV_3172011 [Trichonephila clavipes]
MYDSSPYVNPTPLAHADASRDVLPRGVPSWYGGTLNNHRESSLLVRLLEGEERWEAPDHPQGVLTQNWGETKHGAQNRTVTCMMLKAKPKDRRKKLALRRDEFHGP